MNKVNYNTIIRFFKNECSEEERLLIIKWVNESQEHAEQFFRWEELYHLGNNSEKENDLAIRKAEKKLYERIEIEKSHQWFFSTINRWVKYAAVITSILAISGLTLWYFVADSQEKWITASTTNGETLEITLPDNSKVWLNENSILKYPEHFTKEKRELHLTGEAYFEVTKNKHKPFTVQSSAMNVQVLGTKFNAKAYLDEPSWITLKEGSVEVSTLDDRSKERMSPNDQVYYTVSDGLVLIRNSAQANVDSWTTGDLRFDNKTLKEMAKVIERRYDVKIRIMDSSLVEEYFTCHFRKDLTIAQAMELLKETRRVDYRIEKKTVYLYKK